MDLPGTKMLLKPILLVLLCCLSSSVLGQNEDQVNLNKLSQANAFFADRLYKQLSTNSTNLIFSPLSISVALSMLGVGAGGRSFQELNSTLGFQFAQLNEQELLQGYQIVVTNLTELRDGYQFSLANAQFVQNDFPIYPNYSSILADDFQAESRTVDFAQEQETLAEINGWVNNATNGKIDSILESVTPLDVMALLNAVYFKGQWLYQFDENQTTPMRFTNENGKRKLVNMMVGEIPAKYMYNREHPLGASVLELPYKGHTFSMIFVLPSFESNLTDLEQRLTPTAILEITKDLKVKNVSVVIPRIKLESDVDLIPHLEALGVHDIFTDLADLHGISPIHTKVTQAKHKATVDINEEGSEASAVTVIVTTTRSGSGRPLFLADRPFMYMLRHNPTNTICFMGRVAEV